jgi:hypothetical protein
MPSRGSSSGVSPLLVDNVAPPNPLVKRIISPCGEEEG